MLLVIATFLSLSVTAYAGNINEQEQRLVNVVSVEVTHTDGKNYIADEVYVLRLKAYLSQDNVDLTEADADKAINKFYNSIQMGIDEGYMVPVDDGKGGTTDGGKDKPTDEKKEDNKDEDNSSADVDSADDKINEATLQEETTESVTEESISLSGDTGTSDDSASLTDEEITRLQEEKAMVESIIEEYSLVEEEADVYAAIEEFEESSEDDSDNAKDYSDAEPFRHGISLGAIAIGMVVLVAVVLAVIVLVHKNKRYKRK